MKKKLLAALLLFIVGNAFIFTALKFAKAADDAGLGSITAIVATVPSIAFALAGSAGVILAIVAVAIAKK